MPLEIERKFLVDYSIIKQLLIFKQSIKINQGYLADSKNAMVRVRTYNKKAYLTIKSSIKNDYALEEFEYEIPFDHCIELLDKCEFYLNKERFIIEDGNNTWEVDLFEDGLVLAEFEHENREVVENVEIPYWVIEEVTNNKEYSNFSLAKKYTKSME